MDTVPLSIDTGLQTSSALVQQGILLSFMFVSRFFLALTFVEPNTQCIISVKLCRDPQHVGVTLRGRTIALPTVGLLPVVASSCERIADFLKSSLPQETLNP